MTFPNTKIITLALGMGLTLALSGCGDDLGDRPYVMSCTIRDNPYSARNEVDAARSDHTFDLYSGGLNLPDNDEITRRGGREGDYFYRGVLTDAEGQLDANPVITQPIIDRVHPRYRLERSGQLLTSADRRRGELGSSVALDPNGWADIEHFTRDASGQLTPVEFQLASLQIENQGRTQRKRHANIGARLPADARYVIYKYTIRDIDSPFVDSDKVLTTWWASTLEDKHRWAPKDWDEAQNRPDAFSHYVQFMSDRTGGLGAPYPSTDRNDPDNLRALYPVPNKNTVRSGNVMPCLAGTDAQVKDFISLLGNAAEQNVVRAVGRYQLLGYGDLNVEELPKDLSDWTVEVERDKFNNRIIRL